MSLLISTIRKKLPVQFLSLVILIAVLSVAFSLIRISRSEKELAENILRLNRENENVFRSL